MRVQLMAQKRVRRKDADALDPAGAGLTVISALFRLCLHLQGHGARSLLCGGAQADCTLAWAQGLQNTSERKRNNKDRLPHCDDGGFVRSGLGFQVECQGFGDKGYVFRD